MRRREFITLFGGAAACASWPLVARAQPGKVWRIGMLDTTSAQLNAPNLDAFRQGLRQLGYVEGQNPAIDYRSADGHLDRIPPLASELVRRNVDVIVTRGTPSMRNSTIYVPSGAVDHNAVLAAQRSYAHRFRCGCDAYTAQRVVGDSKNTIILARSSADVSPPYGFMLWPGTTSSGFAMNLSSFSLSHTKSAPFMALE
jgi:DNA-binding transcriptional LysR family regulator